MELVKIKYPHSLGNYIIIKCDARSEAKAKLVQETLWTSSSQFTDNSHFVPSINQTVAIYSAADRKWLRAQVLGVDCVRRECLVRYLEVAFTDTVTFLAVHPVPTDLSIERIPPQSIQITLADVFPVMKNLFGEITPAPQWTHMDPNVIRNQYHHRPQKYMYEHKYTIQGLYFGHLHLCFTNRRVNLGDELVRLGHALRMERWLDNVRRLSPEVLDQLTGGLHMCSKDSFLAKVKQTKRYKARSASVSSVHRREKLCSRSNAVQSTKETERPNQQESLVSSTSDRVCRNSPDKVPLSRRSRSLYRPSENGITSPPTSALPIQIDTGKRSEEITTRQSRSLFRPPERSITSPQTAQHREELSKLSALVDTATAPQSGNLDRPLTNGITSTPTSSPAQSEEALRSSVQLTRESTQSVQVNPGERKSRLSEMLEKLKSQEQEKSTDAIVDIHENRRMANTRLFEEDRVQLSGNPSGSSNGDMPNTQNSPGNDQFNEPSRISDCTTPITSPTSNCRLSISPEARNLMYRMKSKSARQISVSSNLPAVNTNQSPDTQMPTTVNTNQTQLPINAENSNQTSVIHESTGGGMAAVSTHQCSIPQSKVSKASPTSNAPKRLSRREIMEAMKRRSELQAASTVNTNCSTSSPISKDVITTASTAVNNTVEVCPQSSNSRCNTHNVGNSDSRLDSVNISSADSSLNDSHLNSSVNLSSLDTSLNVGIADSSVNFSHPNSNMNLSSPDTSVNVSSPDSSVNVTLKSALSRGRSQCRAREYLGLSPESSVPAVPVLALPQPEEPYLSVCRPVTHSKPPLQCNEVTTGDMETRLHHSIVENRLFPLVSVAQVSSVPAILQRRNLCVVHTLKSQYNSAYLGSLLSLLIEKKSSYFKKKSFEIEPLVLILAPNSKICDELYSVTSSFIDKFCDVTVKTIYGSSPDNEKNALLSAVNGCDILITTPRCLDRLKESKIVGLGWVYHYVLERADIMFEKFSKEVMTFLGYLQVISKARQEKASSTLCPDLQIIVSSEIYNKRVENFLRNKMTQPVLVLSNFLEAAIYGQVEFSLSIVLQHETKLQYLLEILQKYSTSNEKIAILCQNCSDVMQVSSYLSSIYPNLFPIHSGVNIIDTHCYMTRWKHLGKQGETPILICDDEAMCNIFVEDVTVLIHFSLPHQKKALSRRFKLIKSALLNLFEDQDGGEIQCGRTHILLDESNDIQFFDIVTLGKRLQLDIPCRVLEQAKAVRLSREGEKRTVPLCHQLLMFGQCDLGPCKYRHAFIPALDAPAEHLPREGKIRFNILSVLDGSCFTIRIFHKLSPSGEWKPHRDSLATINLAMKLHFAKKEARVTHYNPGLGDLVAVERPNGQMARARVIEIWRGGDGGDVATVKVRLCDAPGKATVFPVSKLLVVPEELKKYPDQVVLVFATRLLPIDEDIQWNHDTCRFLESLVDEHMRGEHEKYFVGKIVLALNNTYLLDPLQCCQYLPSSSVEISHFSVRDSLLSSGRALPHPSHLELLYEQCGHIQGTVPGYMREKAQEVLPVSPFAELPSPKWAILNQEIFNDCTLVGIVDPSLFFLKLNQFNDILSKLNKEILADVKRTTSRYYREQCRPGLLCLARSDDNSGYNRVQVTNTDDPHVAMVLFVDFSDKQDILYEDLVPIHRPQLISNLPFQAIECCLAGVEPADGPEGKWTQAAYDYLDDFNHLFARVVSVKLKGVETGGRQYAVELFEWEERVNLNKQIVLLGHARYTEDATVSLSQDDEAVFNEIQKLLEAGEETNDDLEEWEDLEDKEKYVSAAESSKDVATSSNQDDDIVINEAALLEEDISGFMTEVDPEFLSEQKQMVENMVSSREIPALPSSSSTPCDGTLPDSSSTKSLDSSVANNPQENSNVNSSRSDFKFSTPDTYDMGVKLTPLPDDIDPAMPPLTIYSYPARAEWYQRGDNVHVHFHLPGLHEGFTLNVECKFVHFYVEVEDRLYENQLPLLCFVVPEQSHCEWNGFELRLKLKKQMPSLEWPCLLEDGVDKEIRWLAYHVDHLCDTEDAVCSDEDFMEPGPPIDGVKGIKGKNNLSSEDEDLMSDSEGYATCNVPEDL